MPIFIHTRPDVAVDVHHTLVMRCEERNQPFHPEVYYATRVRQPGVESGPFVPAGEATNLPEVDSVLMSLMLERCEPNSLCLILAHAKGPSYRDRDYTVTKAMSESFHFNLEDVTIYPVENGRVALGMSFDRYFSDLM